MASFKTFQLALSLRWPGHSILEIPQVFLRLNFPIRLELERTEKNENWLE
jgi:hypothetical protein